MKIKLTGELDHELISIGLRTGDIIEATPDIHSTVGCMHFEVRLKHITCICSIWPENYKIIKKN